jgi:hypothetical protein
MAKSLKDKVVDALKEAAGLDAHIELDEEPGDKVGGLVLSSSFADQSPTERQDKIWQHLDKHLTPFEQTRVIFIVTDTPEEYEAMKKAAG